jgi:hypothetical protein
MGTFQCRALTPGEIALGADVFGAEIPWPRVRVFQAPRWLGFGAMVPIGKTIVFARWRALRDFSQAGLEEQGWFMHELAHVWQAEQGVVLAGAKLGALGEKAYAYEPRPGARLRSYKIERQAEIVRHLMLARAGAPAKGAPPREWLEEVWQKRLV